MLEIVVGLGYIDFHKANANLHFLFHEILSQKLYVLPNSSSVALCQDKVSCSIFPAVFNVCI